MWTVKIKGKLRSIVVGQYPPDVAKDVVWKLRHQGHDAFLIQSQCPGCSE